MEGMAKVSCHIPVKQVEKVDEVSSQNKQSYASCLHGGRGSKLDRHDAKSKSITLNDDELVQVTNSMEVALVKSIDIEDSDSYTSDTDSKVDDSDHNEEEYESKWTNSDEVFYMINTYGPQDASEKTSLWNRLLDFIANHEGQFFIFGDLNEVRDERKRYGTEFSRTQAYIFNSFIDDAGLLDIPLGGLTTLSCGWSDHTPLLLHYEKADYGPIPFKIFHSWLQRDGFNECIENAYAECSQGNTRMLFHDKLKVIKQKIIAWNLLVKSREVSRMQEVRLRLSDIDDKIDNGIATEEEKQERLNLIKECDEIQNLEEMDTVQKAKIKWDVEGDENSKFFHGILKQKRHQQMASDSMMDLSLVTPQALLSLDDNNELEKAVNVEEIRVAVWD
ncbi:RNA-directed DNA polymerase, eukaryota, reverse transcriptase zinc-binding domain protein [Tanacetum coccineum]